MSDEYTPGPMYNSANVCWAWNLAEECLDRPLTEDEKQQIDDLLYELKTRAEVAHVLTAWIEVRDS